MIVLVRAEVASDVGVQSEVELIVDVSVGFPGVDKMFDSEVFSNSLWISVSVKARDACCGDGVVNPTARTTPRTMI